MDNNTARSNPDNVRSDSTPADDVRPLLEELLNNVTHEEQWQQLRSDYAENATVGRLCNFVDNVIALCSLSAGAEMRFCQDTAVTSTTTVASMETETAPELAQTSNTVDRNTGMPVDISQETTVNLHSTAEDCPGARLITNIQNTNNVKVIQFNIFKNLEFSLIRKTEKNNCHAQYSSRQERS